MNILGISGSLQSKSFNSALLKAAVETSSEHLSIVTFDISVIPFYNGDVEARGFPESVVKLREQIASADGLLIATPEYNYSVSGVLKNAIDWASRPPKQPFAGKRAAILGASSGIFGTVRSQDHLRRILGSLNMAVMPKPEMMVAKAASVFDENGVMVDVKTKEKLAAFLDAFSKWCM